MLDLSPEIAALDLPEPRKAALLARERREIFSIHPEIRGLAWGGAMLITAAAAILIRDNLDRLGPALIAAVIGVAAAACYAWAWLRRARASVVDDYVLLLGALLLSADLGFIEQQFDVFGAQGHRHFLLLAVAHGIVAYLFDSRLVLTLSVSALAAWIGVERRDALGFSYYGDTVQTASRLLTAALATLTWREADRRFRANRSFARPLEHFTANFALVAGVALTTQRETQWLGLALTAVVAALTITWGFRVKAEAFVLYSVLYLVFAIDVVLIDGATATTGLLILAISSISAIVGLFMIHARFPRSES